MKTSLITTVFNEGSTIEKFLKSIAKQTKLPNEIIIVDAYSKDKTVEKILDFKKNNKKLNITLIQKNGNIALGRNTAISKASGEIILCSDAGCILDKNWIENILKPFKDTSVDVVSGYYKPLANSVFEECLSTYTSVMPDKLDEQNFLPSSRSIAFKKSAWEKIGGYPQYLDRCEDLIFAKNLKDKNFKFKFARKAVVFWPQRKNIFEAFKQFFLYAKGDGRAKYIRPQVPLIYLRYILAFYILFISILERSLIGVLALFALVIIYFIWAIKKNYKYVKNEKAVFFLPVLQIAADVAVIAGTSIGLLQRFSLKMLTSWIKSNKFFLLITFIYVFLMLLTLKKGAPNINNPFPYNMDEWHQFQAVRTTVKYGTPNVFGSANGTMFHFIVSAVYLVPFTLLHYINPVVLHVNDYVMRERIFMLLRLNTIIYGVLSIFIIYEIAKKIKASKNLAILLFVFCPLWIMLSGYFKYDIALMFWILVSICFFAKFINSPTNRNFLLISIPIALAFSVKVSAIPLFPIYFFSFFWFKKEGISRDIKTLILGLLLSAGIIVLFGIPDTIFGKGNIYHFFYENVISGPVSTDNFNIGMNSYEYILIRHYPIIFGHGLIVLFLVSILFLIYLFLKNGIRKSLEIYKIDLFLLFSFFMFLISFLPLQIFAGGNRSLVLLPYMVLFSALLWTRMKKHSILRIGGAVVILIVLAVQIYESLFWLHLKYIPSPQETSSGWIARNIPEKSVIGIENIPIYQGIPDIVQKEFYYDQARVGQNNKYKYIVVNKKSSNLPGIIIITNDQVEKVLFYNSPKNDLVRRLEKEGYKKVAIFRSLALPYKISDKDLYLSWMLYSPVSTSVYIK